MGVSEQTRSPIRFGDYELDPQGGSLRKGGLRIRLQEQPLQVLAALVERPGELVNREELRRRLWPQETFVDFDHALNTAIKKIRAALNDDADAPRYIETVPRRGYRFIATVEREPVAVPVETAKAAQPPRSGRSRLLLAVTGTGLVLCAVLGVLWRFGPWQGEASTSPEFQRLTFGLPDLGQARFTSDGASVLYSSGESSHNSAIYAQRIGAPGSHQLGISNATLLGLSPQSELAVQSFGPGAQSTVNEHETTGTLARVPMEGGSPRELLPQVEAADWSPSGQLAVVRRVGDKSRLEFPTGNVLYETTGWIASPRFSPAGDSIAFLDHPVTPDDRGSVAIVDLDGKKRTLSAFWETLRGLAWSTHGDEVWFAAAQSGVSRALYAVTTNGQQRRVLSIPGGLSLQDISRDGRVLLSRDSQRLGIQFVNGDEEQPRDLSWKDWSIVVDITPDGKQILIGEEGENSGPSYQVALRKTDGSAPVLLGTGGAQSLSPDGKWALSIIPPPENQIVLLPTGPGSAKTLERGTVESYQHLPAKWFPDSRQIIFVGNEPGHGPRCYAQSIEGGKPRAITPDGILACNVAPDGKILAFAEGSRALLYSSQPGGQPEKEFKLLPGERPSGWTADGKFLYLTEVDKTPATISRLEIATGRRSPWRELPPFAKGSTTTFKDNVVITPDGQSYAYTYCEQSFDLYVVAGLK